MFARTDFGREMIPEFRRLVLVIPLEIDIAGGEIALLGPGRVLVAADAGDEGVEFVGDEALLQRHGLEFVGDCHRIVRLIPDAALARLLVDPDDQIDPIVVHGPGTKFEHFWKLIGRIDMHDRKRDMTAEGLFRQPEQDVGVFAHGPEHGRPLKCVKSLAQQVDALGFELVEMRHYKRRNRDSECPGGSNIGAV
jgi:hypothetical protein